MVQAMAVLLAIMDCFEELICTNAIALRTIYLED